MDPKHSEHAKVFKAFCDENRLMILEMLRTGEQSAAHLIEELKIAQSTLSHHMKVLCVAGVVRARREGKRTFYTFNREGCDEAMRLLAALTALPTRY